VAVEIIPARSKREMKEFIELPYRLYRNEPLWVPPLRFERRQVLDRKRNPFFKHAEVEFFLAKRDGRTVGRISAHKDRNLNEFQDNRWGLFGWFECEDDQEVATALIETARQWAIERGCDRIVGPMSFTTNDECGVLVDGFDLPPSILTDWTMPYYPKLLEGAGTTKAMDTFMWSLYVDQRESVHPAIFQMADEVKSKHGIDVRPMNKRNLKHEIPKFIEVYNEAWSKNWAFVPIEREEALHYAKNLRPILDENWAFIAEKDGEVVGASLTLPDYNQVLEHLNGRLLPFGWVKALWYRRKINRVRVFALGVRHDWHHTGIAAKMYALHFDSAEKTPQSWGETGWILESNVPMNRAMEGMGGKIIRRYRIYESLLEQGAEPSTQKPWDA
jgi:GNAT superfamily N-acetyltransferase